MMREMFTTIQCESSLHLLGLWHICLLVGSFTFLNWMVKYQKQNIFIEKISTLFILGLQIILYIWYIIGPESLFLKGLPLYTCRIVLYLFTIGIFCNNKFCLKLGSYWGFYGGIAGLIFPTIFKYPFPHILQITTLLLHVYIMLISGNYLFVKKIGSTRDDVKMCCIITTILLTINTIINFIFGTNYTSTTRMPLHLINLGITIPVQFCYLAVVLGYIIVTIFQHWVVGKVNSKYDPIITTKEVSK